MIFEIALEGARKVVTVKSALTVINHLTYPVEMMAILNDRQYKLTAIEVQGSYVVPLPMLRCHLYCRPLQKNVTYDYCTDDLNWREVIRHGEKGFLRVCKTSTKPPSFIRYSI